MHDLSTHNAIRLASWAGVALLGVTAVFELSMGRGLAAVIFAAFGVAAAAFLAVGNRLSVAFGPLIVLTAILNAAGWAWGVFRPVPGYDESVHAFTTFVLTLYAGAAAARSLGSNVVERHRLLVIFGIVGVGIALGALWEGVELVTGVPETRPNSIGDLMADAVGAAVAGPLSLWHRLSGRASSKDGPPKAQPTQCAPITPAVDAGAHLRSPGSRQKPSAPPPPPSGSV